MREEEFCEKLQDMYNVYVYERSKDQSRRSETGYLQRTSKEGEKTTDTGETKKTCRKP